MQHCRQVFVRLTYYYYYLWNETWNKVGKYHNIKVSNTLLETHLNENQLLLRPHLLPFNFPFVVNFIVGENIKIWKTKSVTWELVDKSEKDAFSSSRDRRLWNSLTWLGCSTIFPLFLYYSDASRDVVHRLNEFTGAFVCGLVLADRHVINVPLNMTRNKIYQYIIERYLLYWQVFITHAKLIFCITCIKNPILIIQFSSNGQNKRVLKLGLYIETKLFSITDRRLRYNEVIFPRWGT